MFYMALLLYNLTILSLPLKAFYFHYSLFYVYIDRSFLDTENVIGRGNEERKIGREKKNGREVDQNDKRACG